MDSSTLQMHKWAAQEFGTTVGNIDSISFGTEVSGPYGCETCGPEYETLQVVRVVTKDGKYHVVTFEDVFLMMSELTQDFNA